MNYRTDRSKQMQVDRLTVNFWMQFWINHNRIQRCKGERCKSRDENTSFNLVRHFILEILLTTGAIIRQMTAILLSSTSSIQFVWSAHDLLTYVVYGEI